MRMIAHPIDEMYGEMQVPGDKSMSHRALLLGAIAVGQTVIEGFLPSDDCLSTRNALLSMGVCITQPSPETVLIEGQGGDGLFAPGDPIDCGNSGTLMRLLAGLMAAQSFESVLTGDLSLQNRPMSRVCFPLQTMGANIHTHKGKPPIHIRPVHSLTGITYEMPIASAQVKSCLLLAGLYARGETVILENTTTRDHTERMLKAFSYPIAIRRGQVAVLGGQHCIGAHVNIPGDLSSAAFFVVAATLIKNASIMIRSVGINPTRMGFVLILRLMGADIQVINERFFGEEPVGDLLVKHAPLHGVKIPPEFVSLAIDEFPILFIAAACAKGKTSLSGAQELRAKESDRLVVMADGLRVLGIDVDLFDDGINIEGGTLNGGLIDSQLDHRVAMAFLIAGAVAQSSVVVQGIESISTSFPEFFEIANQMGLDIKECEDA